MGVPIARRNLLQSRARLVISVGGVALAALLVLALDAVFAGASRDVTVFMQKTPFDLVVSQRGVRNLHMTTSFFPRRNLQVIERIDGVDSVDPILFTTTFLIAGDAPSERGLAYLIGYEPGRLGGPWAWATEPATPGPGEIVIDTQVAEDFGLQVGDEISAGGRELRIAGLASDTTSIVNSISFVSLEDLERAQGTTQTVSFALIRTEAGADPETVAEQIRRRVEGVTVQTRRAFAENERRIVSDMSIDIMRMMNLIAFLIGLAVSGLSIYVATVAKLREYGVMKAIGATNGNLARIVLGQAALSVVLGLLAALLLAFILQAALRLSEATIPMAIEAGSVAKVTVGATVVAVLGALLPIARIAGLRPADVFRR